MKKHYEIASKSNELIIIIWIQSVLFSDSYNLERGTKSLIEQMHKDIKTLKGLHVETAEEVGEKQKSERI